MKLNYEITENDLLTYQLFMASRSVRINKQRQRNKYMGLLYLPIGLIFFFSDKLPLTVAFSILGIAWFFAYPVWERKKYIKNYQLFVQENQKDRIGRITALEISDEFISAKDHVSEGVIQSKELEGITEIPSLILLRLKGGQSFIIPKEQLEITELENTRIRLKELAAHLQISYEEEQNWEWK